MMTAENEIEEMIEILETNEGTTKTVETLTAIDLGMTEETETLHHDEMPQAIATEMGEMTVTGLILPIPNWTIDAHQKVVIVPNPHEQVRHLFRVLPLLSFVCV